MLSAQRCFSPWLPGTFIKPFPAPSQLGLQTCSFRDSLKLSIGSAKYFCVTALVANAGVLARALSVTAGRALEQSPGDALIYQLHFGPDQVVLFQAIVICYDRQTGGDRWSYCTSLFR